MTARSAILLACLALRTLPAATFGTVVPITGGPTDLVLDEARGRLYIVDSTQNRVEVYSLAQRRLLDPLSVDRQPLAAAMSRSGRYLYVTSYDASVLDVIDLNTMSVATRVSLPAAPEGVAVGGDERVLITTVGAGANDTSTRLLLYDPNAMTGTSLLNITSSLPAPASPATPSAGQVFNSARSHLLATPDGSLIIGVNASSNTSQTVFVYEVASASILRSRSVTNISSVLSVTPDGGRFMAGLSLFDTATLAILAQQNAANSTYPFPQNVNFNLQQNQGGSVFSPDGAVLYSAFNVAPVQNPAARANSSQMMLSDPENLLIQLGLQLPENLMGKMAITSNGANVYALSQSGLLALPVSAIYDSPIASVDSTAVLLTNDQCGATAATRSVAVTVSNRGKGRMTATAQVMQTGPTFTFPLGGQNNGTGAVPGGGGAGGGAGAGGPGQGIPIILPGGGLPVTLPVGAVPGTGTNAGAAAGTTTQQNSIVQTAPQVRAEQAGTRATLTFSFSANAASSLGTGTPFDFLVQSPEAINIPSRIRVYQNNRNTEANGTIVAAPISVSTGEGLVDVVSDTARQRLYIANSGLNRLEVFDTRANQFLAPIKVGQLPRSIAMSPDGNMLYVANTGGESISVVDLEKGQVTGKVAFPPLPYNASVALITPAAIAATLSGLQIVMSNGTLWKAVNNQALPRPTSTVIGTTALQAPRSIVATPGGEYALLLAGNGVAYLYDAMSDDYVVSQQVVSTPIQGYYGPMAAGPRGQYWVVNGQVLNPSLTPVGAAQSANGGRAVAAVATMNAATYLRFTQPARANTTAVVTDTPSVEIVDANTGVARGASVAVLEGPLSTQVGTQRVNVGARTMAVDAAGTTGYVLTASGLSIVPLSGGPPQSRLQINANGVLNLANYSASVAPNMIVSIFGQNLASDATASAPLPAILGGSCATLDNQPLPLMMTSPGQVNAQLPPGLATGKHSLVVRSIDRKSASVAQTITVSKYAPAVYVNTDTGMAALVHADGAPVSKSRPAKRDETLSLYAAGLGATKGATITAGNATPDDAAAVTDTVQVYFGDPGYKEAAVIVESSALAPGFVGVYAVNVRVPGAHIKGDAVPVTLRIGGVSSTAGGATAPTVAVE